MELIAQLSQPITFRNQSGKLKVNKYGKASSSPDKAESVMYSFAYTEIQKEVDANDYRTMVTYGKKDRMRAINA